MYFFGALLLVLNTGLGTTATPSWNPTYTVKGTLFIPSAELAEPFHAWYDEPGKQSRIDYYGDMVKTYQISNFGEHGASFKLIPITTEYESNVRTCLQANGSADMIINPQQVMPVLDSFSFVGQETINEVSAEKWQLVEKDDERDKTHTVWLYYRTDPDELSVKVPVPVRYEKRSYNSASGSVHDHFYLDYVTYDTSEIPKETFAISEDMQCAGFPENDFYMFNPMAEYIRPETTTHVDFEFSKFVKKHSRTYISNQEHSTRKEIFRQNLRFINSHNRQGKGYTLAVNHLADRTDLELRALRGRRYSTAQTNGAPFPYELMDRTQLPAQLNWQMYGAVTPVKDQSMCGSCWAFGTTGVVEGANFLKTGTLVSLSQQALMDCSWGYDNTGCEGGLENLAYDWMVKHGGIPTEEAYGPYLAQEGYCHVDNVTLTAKITGYVNVTPGNERALRYALVNHGPISVAIDASQRSFMFYSHGVYYDSDCDSQNLDHAVLAVGYGTMNGQNYWLIKNSWSSNWGNDGYILMASKNNNCGVMTTPTYVTM